jgi:uncharacterized protein (DUF3820 family)
METDARSEAVRSFQEDEEVRIFVGSIRAAGVGLTLTAASHVVFLEMDWSPGVMAQAEDRCHRVGQHDSVQVQYYVFKDTIDEWIAKSLLYKQSNIDQILPEKVSGAESGYVFDFGKHSGLRLEDVPRNYIQFLVRQEVWRNRPALWRALAMKGIVFEEPPPSDGEDSGMVETRDPPASDARSLAMESIELDSLDPGSTAVENIEPLMLDLDSEEEEEFPDASDEPIELIVQNTDHPRVTIIKAASRSAKRKPQVPRAGVVARTDNPRVSVTTALPRKLSQPTPRITLKPPPRVSSSPALSAKDEVNYVFDFGKHSGKKWSEVPPNYREWILREGVWKSRTGLKEALTEAGVGLVEEDDED